MAESNRGSKLGSLVRLSVALLAVSVLVVGAARAADPATKPAKTTPARPPVLRTSTGAAPDFAPGQWTDGGDHHISDYRGKVLLVFSFDPKYIDSPADVKRKLDAFRIYADKPVAFLGVVSGRAEIASSKSLLRSVDVNVPMYFDNIGQMAQEFPGGYSTVHVRMIDADGNFSGYSTTPAEVGAMLKDLKWKYKENDYDKRLDAVVDLFEWNHYEAGLKQLRPLRKSGNKDLAAAAEKLYKDVHAEGEQWQQQADALKESEPAKAFEQYQRISAAFAGEDLGKAADDAIKQLRPTKPVQDELAAREMYNKLYQAIPRAKFEQKLDVADFCEGIAKKYPKTPTAAKATAVYNSLMSGRGLD